MPKSRRNRGRRALPRRTYVCVLVVVQYVQFCMQAERDARCDDAMQEEHSNGPMGAILPP